jgi:hypothetical protein
MVNLTICGNEVISADTKRLSLTAFDGEELSMSYKNYTKLFKVDAGGTDTSLRCGEGITYAIYTNEAFSKEVGADSLIYLNKTDNST